MAQDLISALRKDHKEVKTLFSKLEKSKKSAERAQLIKDLQQELMAHMQGEEKVVYPSLKKVAKDDVQHSVEEHKEAKEQLKIVLSTDANDDSIVEKLMQLKDMVEHHVEEEEKKIFKDLQDNKSKDELSQILQGFEKEKQSFRSKSTH